MIRSIVVKLAKKYAVNAVREAVTANKEEVAAWAMRVGTWAVKVRSVLMFLMSVSDKLGDGALSEDEADAVIEEAKALAEDVTGRK